MKQKKGNFFPLLLIGGGLAGAALLYSRRASKTEENPYISAGGSIGGASDFFGNSGSTPENPLNPALNPVYLYPDSVANGVEDIATGQENYGLVEGSDGGINPSLFSDIAVYAGTSAAVSATGYGIKKAAGKVAGSTAGKVAGSTAEKVVSSTAEKVASSTAGKVAGSTAGKVAGTVAKGAGVLGVVGLVDMLFDVTGLKDAHFSQSGLTGNLQGVNTNLATGGTITTDKATKESTGMTTARQEAHALGLSAGKYPITKATPEESALVNKAVGLSGGDVLKVTGSKFTSYIPEQGMQVTFSSGQTLTGAVNTILENKARKK